MPGERENRDPDLYSDRQVPGAKRNLSDLPILRAAQPSRRHLLSTVSTTTADCRRQERRAAIEVCRAGGWWRHGRTGYRCGAACRIRVHRRCCRDISVYPAVERDAASDRPEHGVADAAAVRAADGLAQPLPHALANVRPLCRSRRCRRHQLCRARRRLRPARSGRQIRHARHGRPATPTATHPAAAPWGLIRHAPHARPTSRLIQDRRPRRPSSAASQQGDTMTINCNDNSTGQINSWSWTPRRSAVRRRSRTLVHVQRLRAERRDPDCLGPGRQRLADQDHSSQRSTGD